MQRRRKNREELWFKQRDCATVWCVFCLLFCFDFTEDCFGAMMKSSIEAAALIGEQTIPLPLFPLLFSLFTTGLILQLSS